MSRLRVLLVAPTLDILGGQSIQADRLLSWLREEESLSVELLPVNPRFPGPLRLLQRVKYLRTLATEPVYLFSLLIKVPRFDVLHIFSASYWSFLLAPVPALLAGRLYRRKCILNYRSGEAGDHLARWRTAIPLLRLAHRIVVPSGYLVEVFGRFGLAATAIANTVDADQFRFRARRPLRPRFIANRNLEPMYDVGTVIRAFALLRPRYPDASLTIIGDGSQRADLEKLAADLAPGSVRFLGRAPNSGMPARLDEADVYLNASLIDNMPGSILEAFAAGLPVVTTGAGGIPWMVTHRSTGLLVPESDPGAMAAAILVLLENQELAQSIILRARDEVARYGWPRLRREWLDLYRQLAAE